jgi:hypothetical protein
MANSSISDDGDDDARMLTRPGERTGEGLESIVPYLHEELATRPQELPPDRPKPRRSLSSRFRKALMRLRK